MKREEPHFSIDASHEAGRYFDARNKGEVEAHNKIYERCTRCLYNTYCAGEVYCFYSVIKHSRRPCKGEDGTGNCTAFVSIEEGESDDKEDY